jgi:hypothetical protein
MLSRVFAGYITLCRSIKLRFQLDLCKVKPKAVARLIGGCIIIFNLWLIGQYRIEGVLVLLLTFGVAAAFELLIVRPLAKAESGPSPAVAQPAPPSTQPVAVRSPPTQPERSQSLISPTRSPSLVPSESAWATAASEFDGAERRQGLWARVFSETNGAESAAKAAYLRIRATEIEEEEQARAASKTEAEAAAEFQRREAERIEAKSAYDALAKGACPNYKCRAIIPMNSQACPSCGAIFEEGAVWKVRPWREG